MTDTLHENQKTPDEQISEEKPELAIETSRPSDDFEDESRVVAADDGATENLTSFADAPLSESLRQAIADLGWKQPTPVQGMCLPLTLIGRDVAGFAQTGTGKTGVFLISTAQRILEHRASGGVKPSAGGAAHPLALVLAPTRELAMQIEQDAQNLFGRLGISSIAVFGGIDYDKQAKRLKEGVDVIIATPGRLKDYFEKKLIRLEQCKIFVCDEADRMFDMGFIEDVEFFLGKLPEDVQKLLFSATTNDEVKELAFEYLDKPAYISVNPETLTPENIEQHAIIVDAPNKLKVMLGMLREHKPTCCIIFTNTKLTAEWLHYKLSHNGIDVDLITGDLPQRKRIQLIHKIKEGKVKALIATDVASRGLHISRITHVYNFDLPQEPANYVHRIGRTARAGAKGSSFSLVCDDYGENFAPIKDLLGEQFPVKSKWYDSAYDSVADEAGNPFEERIRAWKEMKASRSSAGRSGASRHPDRHQDRGPRRDGRPGDRSQQPRRDARPGDRPQHARRDGQPPRRHDGQQQPRHHDGHQRPRHDRHQDRHQERHRDKQHRDRNVHARHGQAPAPVASAKDKSVVGLVKKMFRALFGG
jgi:ATP-dependent RNA helicase RhlB